MELSKRNKDVLNIVKLIFNENIRSIEQIKCPFDWKKFYDTIKITTNRRIIFCKFETDYKPLWHLLTEYKINKLLYKDWFKIPKPLGYFWWNNHTFTKMSFYDFIEWSTLYDKNLNNDIIIKIANTLKKLHTTKINEYKSIVRSFGDWELKEDLKTQFNKKINKLLNLRPNLKNKLSDIINLYNNLLKKLNNIDHIRYKLCKKDLNEANRLINTNNGLYFIDNEFFQIAPIIFDFYDIFNNVLSTETHKEIFINAYWKVDFHKNYNNNLVKLVAILKATSMLITYYQAKNKDHKLKQKAEIILFNK